MTSGRAHERCRSGEIIKVAKQSFVAGYITYGSKIFRYTYVYRCTDIKMNGNMFFYIISQFFTRSEDLFRKPRKKHGLRKPIRFAQVVSDLRKPNLRKPNLRKPNLCTSQNVTQTEELHFANRDFYANRTYVNWNRSVYIYIYIYKFINMIV